MIHNKYLKGHNTNVIYKSFIGKILSGLQQTVVLNIDIKLTKY